MVNSRELKVAAFMFPGENVYRDVDSGREVPHFEGLFIKYDRTGQAIFRTWYDDVGERCFECIAADDSTWARKRIQGS